MFPNKRGKLELLTHTTLHKHSLGATGHTRRRNVNRPVAQAPSNTLPGSSDSSGGEDNGMYDDGDEGLNLGDSHCDPAQIEFERGSIRPEIPPESSAAGSADQLGDRWNSIREDLTSFYIRQLEQNTETMQNRMLSLQTSVQRTVNMAASKCPTCCSDAQLSLSKEVPVLWVGSQLRFQVVVPVKLCHACCTHSTVNPLQACCFPSTTVHSWDLKTAPFGSRPTWFDLGLLKVCLMTMHDHTACPVCWCTLQHDGVPLCRKWTCRFM